MLPQGFVAVGHLYRWFRSVPFFFNSIPHTRCREAKLGWNYGQISTTTNDDGLPKVDTSVNVCRPSKWIINDQSLVFSNEKIDEYSREIDQTA
jgi:hypothetical protein